MKNFFKKHTLLFIVFIIAVALFSNLITGFLQGPFAKNLSISYLIDAACKYSISILPITLMVKWGIILTIILSCFSIGLLEESLIRGVVLPLLCEKWKDKKHFYLKAAFSSSLNRHFIRIKFRSRTCS